MTPRDTAEPAKPEAQEPGPWTYSPQKGTPGHCFQAQVWGPDGETVLALEPTSDPAVATERARRICATWNALCGLKTSDIEAGVVGDLRQALEACAEKFREYEALHLEKIDRIPKWWGGAAREDEAKAICAKAEANARMAVMCERVLAKVGGGR
jgi:hypothetical protein